MSDTIAPTSSDAHTTTCPHCRKQFAPAVDKGQLPRLQGAKCPHCKLFVPARSLVSPAQSPAIPSGSVRRGR
jgi:hypothetical protein